MGYELIKQVLWKTLMYNFNPNDYGINSDEEEYEINSDEEEYKINSDESLYQDSCHIYSWIL